MKIVKQEDQLDCIAEPGDVVEVRVEDSIIKNSGKMLYVDVNGRTVLRIGRIEPTRLNVELS